VPAFPGAHERGALAGQGWAGVINAPGNAFEQVSGESRPSLLTSIALTMLSNQDYSGRIYGSNDPTDFYLQTTVGGTVLEPVR
jgi:hypothetical protein